MSPAEMKKKAARQSNRRGRTAPEREAVPGYVTGPKADPVAEARQPIVVRSCEAAMTGIRSFNTSRCVLGYVVSGHKYIYMGDLRSEASAGDIFFLSKGFHHIEEVPDGSKPFEQILFFYTPGQMSRIVAALSVDLNADTCVHHTCEECMIREYVISPGWKTLRHFFAAINSHIREGYFSGDPIAEILALTSLVYHIISRPEGCLRTRVLGSTDPEKELMERLINQYIFTDMTLKEFAEKNNRSLTSFKKKFREYYNESPHRWVVRQRLMHARLQVISTDKSIAQIGAECRFPNTSHFIRSFGREFGMTPVQYRRQYNSAEGKVAIKASRSKTGTVVV